MSKKLPTGAFTTEIVRCVYVAVEEKQSASMAEDSKKEYHVTILIPEDSKTMEKLEKAFDEAVEAGFSIWKTKKKPTTVQFENLVRSYEDVESLADKEYAQNKYVLKLHTEYEIPVFDQDYNGLPRKVCYSGMNARIGGMFKAYANDKGRGMTTYLNMVMFIEGGEQIATEKNYKAWFDEDTEEDDLL